MRMLPLLLAAVAAPAWGATHPFSVHDMQAMQRITDPRPSPDGRWVAFTVATTDLAANKRRSDIWVAEVGANAVRALTTHEANDTNARWTPDGQHLFFLSARSGSQQVWRLALAGGEPEQITREPLDVENLEVAADGKSLLFSMGVFPGLSPEATRARLDAKPPHSGRVYDTLFIRHWDTWADGTRNHVFAYALPHGPSRDLMPQMQADCPSKPFGGSEEFTLSPDGKTLVFAARDVGREEAWSTNFDLYEVAVANPVAPRKLTANPAWDTQPRFSPDGQWLAYLAMDRASFEADRYHLRLRRSDGTGEERRLDLRAYAGARGDRSPDEFCWSADGREVYWIAEHLGNKALFATDVAGGRSRIVAGRGTTASPRALPNHRVVYGLHSLLGPTELHVASTRARIAPQALTRLNAERVAAARFGKPEQFTFTGAHGDSVYAWLVHPVDFEPGRKFPVAFLIHGGPQGSYGDQFHYRWNAQAYAGAGYAVVMVDFHGSTGYGQAFTDAIRGDWGGAPYEDLMLGLDAALARYPFLDRDRVGALGASYGGFMINWMAGQTDRFKCFVNHDGNFNERQSYFDTEELWFPEWEHHGTPWDNPQAYERWSPDRFVHNWKTPMLVIHGGKDYRVVETQGISTFTALQRRGIPSKFVHFPDENHWVLKPQNSIFWHQTVIGWLDQWLDSGSARR
jgi:dipeptidyl aminopeptidase/acylaminoacyl peptidase